VISVAATPVSTVTGAVSGLDTDLLTVAGVGIGVGAVLFAVRKGWSVVRGMIK
jgi:hypothetical protein